MAFDFHPIVQAGDPLRPGLWYAVSPEGPDSFSAPCQRVGACANYVKSEVGDGGRVFISAGAAPEGLCSDLHELLLTKDSIRWKKVHDGDIPPRYEHATFSLGNDLFVFAGAQTTGPLNDIWRYKISSSCWSPVKSKGSIPPPRTYHSSTTCWHRDKESGQLLVFSGGDAGTSPVRDRKVYKFDPGSGEWSTPSTSGTPPTPRQGHMVAVVGDRMFVHGGMAGEQIFNDVHVLNLNKWVWSHPKVKGVAVPPLAAHGCAVIRTKLYMFGGLTPTGSASDQLYALDTDSLTLEVVSITGPPPPARLDHAMCTIYLTVSSSTSSSQDVEESSTSSTATSPLVDDHKTTASAASGHGQLTPNTVTVISPEGADHEDFCITSDSKSTTKDTIDSVAPKSHSSGSTCDREPMANNREVVESDRARESDGRDTTTESGCVKNLDELSLSEQPSPSKQLTAASETLTGTVAGGHLPVPETVTVPVLFVFGGMDTQGTVHSDSFVIDPWK